MIKNILLVLLMFVGGLTASGATAQQSEDIMVVFDASGSMWGQINGRAKIEIAKEAFTGVSQNWASRGVNAGLIAYGHRRKGDCSDIEILATPDGQSTAQLGPLVSGLTPKGKTPLSDAVSRAADVLKFRENKATVILLSDGVETCDIDPCQLGTQLETLGIDFTTHVIGFGLATNEEKAQLQCLADNTGGKYFDAQSASELNAALQNADEELVTQQAEDKSGTTGLRVGLDLPDGVSFPSFAEYIAINLKTNETVQLGRLEGSGMTRETVAAELENGEWLLQVVGDAGEGEQLVTLTGERQEIFIPYAVEAALFKVDGPKEVLVGQDIVIMLTNLGKLEQSAEYPLWLYDGNKLSADERLTYSTRFGNEDGATEHRFWLSEMSLPEGTYHIIVPNPEQPDDLSSALVNFKFNIVSALSADETSSALNLNLEVLLPDGSVAPGITHWSIFRLGDTDLAAPVSEEGRFYFENAAPGLYEIEAEHIDGDARYEGELLIEIDESGPTDISIQLVQTAGGNASTGDVEPSNSAFNDISVWQICEALGPCSIRDPRVGLGWVLPKGWATEEPFYYTTAGGVQAEQPSVTMVSPGSSDEALFVSLNPRQWMQDLGPCVSVPRGQLCRTQTSNEADLLAYSLIEASFMEQPVGQALDQSTIDRLMGATGGTK